MVPLYEFNCCNRKQYHRIDMNEQDLVVIKSRTLTLKERVISDEVVLVDSVGGDMYFMFELRYVPEDTDGRIRFCPIDDFHAKFEIDTYPTAVTEIIAPAYIGTYENKYDLYCKIVVNEQTPQTGSHNVIITFLRGKEDLHGTTN